MQIIYLLFYKYHHYLAIWFRKQLNQLEHCEIYWAFKMRNIIEGDSKDFYYGGYIEEPKDHIDRIKNYDNLYTNKNNIIIENIKQGIIPYCNKCNSEIKLDNRGILFCDCCCSYYKSLIGKKVTKFKVKREPKPFKSGKKINTVKGIINHPQLDIPAFIFEEDDSYVECRRCYPVKEDQK
ncbi:MAG: hypothetical protein M0R03_08750 [Novosphingobium sp.]|nr:hypothetical protein [Novosphingobium sp.]